MNEPTTVGKQVEGDQLSKQAQLKDYTINGGVSGAMAGGALAALLSALHYGKNRNDKGKKGSRFKDVLKSILWTALGAAGGGVAGAGIGAMTATHVRYKRALEAAIKKVKENRLNRRREASDWARAKGLTNDSVAKGRAMYVNYPQNRFQLGGRPGELLKFLGMKSLPIEHGNLLVMDEDGGNAVMYSPYLNQNKALIKRTGERLIEEGRQNHDKSLIEEGERLVSGKVERGSYDTIKFFNMMKGKSDDEIAKILADYGKNNDLGTDVVVYEGKKGIDREVAEEFMSQACHINHRDGNPGYGILPGFYNCGTASREGFDSVQDAKSHWLDMLFGGFPSNNAPSISRKWRAKSYDVEGRDDLAKSRPLAYAASDTW